MIKSFANKATRELFLHGRPGRFPADLVARAIRKLEYIDLASVLDDLRHPPSNRLHALGGDRKGLFALSVNDQWRICFRFENGDAFDVELTDYH